jgi:hypothetical protein
VSVEPAGAGPHGVGALLAITNLPFGYPLS